MAETTVSRRYAQALIELSAAADVVDRVGEELAGFAELLDAHDGLLGSTLRSPVFTVNERRAVLEGVLPKLDFHPLTVNITKLANDKGRISILGDIATAYTELADERAGRIRVQVETAEPLTKKLEGEVKKALEARTGKQVILQTSVEPRLIGGLVARVGGKVYDSSIRTRLEQIKGALLTGGFSGSSNEIAQA